MGHFHIYPKQADVILRKHVKWSVGSRSTRSVEQCLVPVQELADRSLCLCYTGAGGGTTGGRAGQETSGRHPRLPVQHPAGGPGRVDRVQLRQPVPRHVLHLPQAGQRAGAAEEDRRLAGRPQQAHGPGRRVS